MPSEPLAVRANMRSSLRLTFFFWLFVASSCGPVGADDDDDDTADDDDDDTADDDDSAGDDDDSPGRVASLCACSSAPLSGGQAPGLLGLLLVYGWRRRGSSR